MIQPTRSFAFFVSRLPAIVGLVLLIGLLPCSFLVDDDSAHVYLAQVYAAEKAPAEKVPTGVAFDSHIRPLLSDKCFHCHGPDKNKREADLRLDSQLDEQNDRGDYQLVVPGKPQKSELYRRITTSDTDERMPPEDSDKKLSPSEIEMVRRWIEQGGQFKKHWSFLSPQRPALPKISKADWPSNAIDHFVLARLDRTGLSVSPPADRATLLRRVSLDLIGLPPTHNELAQFLADDSAEAYGKVVDRLLKSPRYGEHMARYWLDAARYADTNGFFTDDQRSMWRWRNWVIDALNRNMPFDQFTIEQLAGDLLPQPTLSQHIASGFNRNHMTTYETGVIDEEYRVEYVIDRLETTSTVWLGMTVGCARCHDHKYDPILQKEFYQLFAFFNQVPEQGNVGVAGNSKPLLQVPSQELLLQIQQAKQKAQAAQQELKEIEPKIEAAQKKWEHQVLTELPLLPAEGLVAHFDMQQSGRDTSGGKNSSKKVTANLVGDVQFAPEMFGSAAIFDGDAILEVDSAIDFDRSDAFSYGAWIKLSPGPPACIISKNDDANSLRGFDLLVRKGKAVAHLIHRWSDNAIQVTTDTSVVHNRWQHIMVTYDGSSKAAGVKIYFDGKPQPVQIKQDRLVRTIRTDQPLRIGRRSTSAPFLGMIDEVRLYNRQLDSHEVGNLVTHQLIRGVTDIAPAKRTKSQKQMLRDTYMTLAAPQNFRHVHQTADRLRQESTKLAGQVPTTMVMQEMKKPRDTFFLMRGQYDQPGEKVTANIPASMPAFPVNAPRNRLGLARWLVDRSHPLTARVTVNRFWQQFFGTGIVKTAEDFGAQGQWPSHPRLLDYLAVELIKSGWNVKQLLRLIVTSSTYRQASITTSQQLQRDPENRLLSRGPRFRLDAETVRDNALAIAGLLVQQTGGASVKPYQPEGLWEAVSYDGGLIYQQDQGDALYRRSLYTYWKRQSPPPGMLTFDAPTRETCTVRRPRTNTPLQALSLLNDPTYVEAARALAERMMKEAGGTPTVRIQFAFQLATSRIAESAEIEVFLEVFLKQLQIYRHNQQAAKKLLSVGSSQRDSSLDIAEHAAWTTVASMILNLDETISKQ